MKLTKEVLEAGIMGYLLGTGQTPPAKNGNGFVERSKHQRRRGRPPKNGYKAILTEKAPVLTAKKRKYTKKSSYWKD